VARLPLLMENEPVGACVSMTVLSLTMALSLPALSMNCA
jgi:hypothetical protein